MLELVFKCTPGGRNAAYNDGKPRRPSTLLIGAIAVLIASVMLSRREGGAEEEASPCREFGCRESSYVIARLS